MTALAASESKSSKEAFVESELGEAAIDFSYRS